jgi:SRSO17 transposase
LKEFAMAKLTKRNRKLQEQPPASGRLPGLKLTPQDREVIRQALLDYQQYFESCFQRCEQRHWSAVYLCGQLSNIERKTIEPMVLGLLGPDPNAVRAVQEFIGYGHWLSEALIDRHQALGAESLGEPHGVVIVDGSGFPKQGQHSVGVARQYCGALGKIANCQEGVFLVYASGQGYTFLNSRLYLPEDWFDAEHRSRWQACGIPDEISFRTEPALALEMLQDLVTRDVIPFHWVMGDEHFGQNPAFLDGIDALGKWYLMEVPSDTRVWLHTPEVEPAGRGPLGRPRLHPRVKPTAPHAHEVREIAARLPQGAWQPFMIQEGSKGPVVADFAFLRVTTVRDQLPGPRTWAVFRRSLSTPPELKSYLSNAPVSCARRRLAQASGDRWPIETVLEEAKGEVGMDHYETRTWCGWHHHMAQTFLAHHFLVRVQLQLKKIACIDRGASPHFRRRYSRRRRRYNRYSEYHRVSTTA